MKLRLAEFRERKRMTQQEIAKIAGVSPKTEWNWEQGKSFPNASQLWDICKALKTDPNTILGWWDEHPRESPPELSRDERELVGCYRDATEGRKSAMMMAARDHAAMSKDAPSAGAQAGLSEAV